MFGSEKASIGARANTAAVRRLFKDRGLIFKKTSLYGMYQSSLVV